MTDNNIDTNTVINKTTTNGKPIELSQDSEAADLLILLSTQSNKSNTSKNNLKSQQMKKTGSSINRDNSSTSSKLRIDQITRSPGPASAALVNGNGSDKAKIAAAALAAAAATPLPMLYKNDLNNDKLTTTNSSKTKLDPPFKKKTTVKIETSETSETSEKSQKPEHVENVISDKADNSTCDSIIKNTEIIQDPISETPVTENAVKDESPQTSNSNTEQTEEVQKIQETNDESSDVNNNDTTPSYAIDPDAGIISCICGFDHDDGLTIQCDKCFRWQHLVCMGFKSINETPDNYQCNLCNKNLKVDIDKAKKLQKKYLNDEENKRKRNNNDKLNDNKSIGAPTFKKRKINSNNNLDRYNTLYYPIDYFIFKSSSIKSLINHLLESSKFDKSIIKFDKFQFNKILNDKNNLIIKTGHENIKSKFNGIPKIGLYTNKLIKDKSCISLMSGELDIKQNYIGEKINKYWILGCAKPQVFFHSNLPIIIDQRCLGNYTRFIRKSCKPNCEIKTILINKNEISFAIFATKEIKIENELTLPWEWDVDHPILNIINNLKTFDSIDHENKLRIVNSMQSIIDLTECACSSTSNDCIFNKIKKFTSHLQRNTRKGNIYHITPSPNQKYIPIQDRFEQRNNLLLNKIKEDENKELVKSDIINDNTNCNDDDNNNISNNNNNNDKNMDIDDENELHDSTKQIKNEPNFKFKSKIKNSIYNLHILPKKFELMRKYQESLIVNNNNNSSNNIDKSIDSNNSLNKDNTFIMAIPIEIDSNILNKIGNTSSTDLKGSIDGQAKDSEIEVEERPKIVKKFSLADYKRKKIG